MSSKYASSTTSLISTNTTSSNWSATKKPSQAQQQAPHKTKPRKTKLEKSQYKPYMSASKFAELAKKNGWASPTAGRPSF
ncbi:hypothetical protein D9615_002772 [Tricholomella constricta]|uniref:Uncharacterized protein n=1 Tax=Tricholomella constricta TaxID=117010 RepID=A0A8H5HFW9_9AGAR|nr:hypothetical protein D9615_002772 [Tricholomella constricta]